MKGSLEMRKIIFILLIILCFSFTTNAQTKSPDYFITTNVLSPLAGANFKSAAVNALMPLLTNMEYGYTLNGGYFKKSYFLETRLTLGKSNSYNFIPQLQFGYNFLIIDYFKKNQNGFYIGTNLRYWDYINKETKTQRHNLSPGINVGYVWKKKRVIVDVRLNQMFAIFTKTNIKHAKAGFKFSFSSMPEFSPVLPFLSVNIGYKFGHKNKTP